MEITYQGVEPLIDEVEQVGDVLEVRFVCPLTGAPHMGRAKLEKGRGLDAISTVERGLFAGLRDTLALLLAGTLGSDKSARARAGEAALAASARLDTNFSDSERKAAALVAFRAVANRFRWDGKGKRWIASAGAGELLTRFARQLETAPVSAEADRAVLSRMLVEVARADGKVTPAGLIQLKERMPFADLSKLESDPAVQNLGNLTVADMCRYVEGKVTVEG